jgi:hypothetical protein
MRQGLLTIFQDRVVAERSMLIKNLIEDLGDESVTTSAIPIPNVNDPVLRKVVEWCEKHRGDSLQSAEDESESRKKVTEIDEWDQKFMQVDQEMLFEIILVCPIELLGSGTSKLIVTGCQLSGYQGPPRCRVQDCRQHDQGQVARGDP